MMPSHHMVHPPCTSNFTKLDQRETAWDGSQWRCYPGNWTSCMGLWYVGHRQTQQVAYMPWPSQFEESHPSRALPNAYSGDPTFTSKEVHPCRCQRWLLTSAWVSSTSVVVKPNKLHICLDPHNLNKATNREHYQMHTLGEVGTRLSQAKKFTLVGAKDGFWQKHLDTESSHKTTFNTPFGWFWWNTVPFGICLAPEVWQCTMHEFWRVCKGWKW